MKLFLTINSGTLTGQSYDLETGFLTVGRGEMCSVRLDPITERIASKQHAFIEAKFDGYYLTDNQSTNGTFINGERVQTAKLRSGDIVQFGRNGVTASISIKDSVLPSVPAQDVPAKEAFRDLQIEQFNKLAESEPVDLQSSLSGIGLGRVDPRPQPKRTGLYIAIGLLILIIPVLITIVALIMLQNVGLAPAILATVIAFIPAMLYLLPLMWLDRYDPEPLWLLALAFTWGALVAVIVSYVVNTVFGLVVYTGTGSAGAANLASALISAPIIEESSKGIGLLILLVFFRRYFDDIVDGIVFGGVIALGFATVENVLYYGSGLDEAYQQYGFTSAALWSFLILFAIRGMFSPFAHATFTSMTGIGCGIARESHNGAVKFIMPILGYILAVVLHMIWNGMTLVSLTILDNYDLLGNCEVIGLGGENVGACGFFVAYIILQVPFFLIFTGFIIFIMRRQRKILNEMLALDVARGLIPEEHLKIATSLMKAQRWRWAGLFSGKYLNRSRYIRAIGKLGLSYWHIQRATAAQGQTASFQQNPILREEVLKWRETV
jgi:RsiW-degrading membrane proteinase PrsW (M82 family)